jgi:hypothetical protein
MAARPRPAPNDTRLPRRQGTARQGSPLRLRSEERRGCTCNGHEAEILLGLVLLDRILPGTVFLMDRRLQGRWDHLLGPALCAPLYGYGLYKPFTG